MISRSRTYAPDYGDITLGDEELEGVKALRILEVTVDSKLTFEIHLLEVGSKIVNSLAVVRRA